VSIIRFGRFLPTSLRDWDRIFRPINDVIQQDADGTTITADNVIAPNVSSNEATYVTLAANDNLPNERVLGVIAGDLDITDNGAGDTVALSLADVGTPGTYPKVTTDARGRVTAGEDLVAGDMPAEVPLRNVTESIDNPWKFGQGITLGMGSGIGIKVDTTAPTFGYRDIIGTVQEPTSGTGKPTWTQIASSGVYSWMYATNDVQGYLWHVPHDYVPGSAVYFHAHWFGPQVLGNATRWQFSYLYARGHDQASFPTTATVVACQQWQNVNAYRHMIAETAAVTIPNLEVDGLIICQVKRIAPVSATDVSGGVFVPCVDLHYMSTNMATKRRQPNFYA
jgi:hypothetical protein